MNEIIKQFLKENLTIRINEESCSAENSIITIRLFIEDEEISYDYFGVKST